VGKNAHRIKNRYTSTIERRHDTLTDKPDRHVKYFLLSLHLQFSRYLFYPLPASPTVPDSRRLISTCQLIKLRYLVFLDIYTPSTFIKKSHFTSFKLSNHVPAQGHLDAGHKPRHRSFSQSRSLDAPSRLQLPPVHLCGLRPGGLKTKGGCNQKLLVPAHWRVLSQTSVHP
jgi:hypothetical protein